MLVKVPPYIMTEELGKNDMIWWLVIRNLKRNLKMEPYYIHCTHVSENFDVTVGAVCVKAKFAKLSCSACVNSRSNTERSWVRFRTWPSLSFKRVIFSYWNSNSKYNRLVLVAARVSPKNGAGQNT